MAPRAPRPTREVDVLIEIPKGSRAKYEYDAATGRIRLDRVLYSSVVYPADYGFIEGTLSGDGDPLDALVVVEVPTFPGCVVPARPIGTLLTRDRKGLDEKVIAVPVGDPRFDDIRELRHLAKHWLLEIETFFATYKTLEGDIPEVSGWHGVSAAWKAIESARRRAREPQRRLSPPQT